jgi:hypothetical protein
MANDLLTENLIAREAARLWNAIGLRILREWVEIEQERGWYGGA